MQATKNRKHGKSHKTAPTRSNEPPAAPPRQLHITCEKQTRLVGLRHQSLPHPILRRERHYRFKKNRTHLFNKQPLQPHTTPLMIS